MSEATPIVNDSPTVVLVHGDWADGSGWAGVITTLARPGGAAASPVNPLPGLSGGIDELRRVVDAVAEMLRPSALGISLPATSEPILIPARIDSGLSPGPTPLPLDLTGREVEVLRLLADGLTNAQIAGRLFISPKTVSTHLVSIFGKLGVTTRASATRFALENGLI
jgi:DNA-binding CsgD family transcriptional regulator